MLISITQRDCRECSEGTSVTFLGGTRTYTSRTITVRYSLSLKINTAIEMAQHFKLRDPELLCTSGWINGQPVKAISGREPFSVHDPATDHVWTHSESMDESDTDAAIAAADAAFPAYSALTARTRARMILKLDQLFREAKSDFAQLIVMETGKALVEAEGEVEYAGKNTKASVQ
jgi:hypothetical protein